MTSWTRLASAAAVLPAAGALAAVTATPASAAGWKPTWTWSSATKQATVTLHPVSVGVATHLWLHRKDPRVTSMQAIAHGPGGKTLTSKLHLASGTGWKGTWRGSIAVPAASPAGQWKVSYEAVSAKHQTSWHHLAASFRILKTPPPALSVTPNPVNVPAGGAGVTVAAFWGHAVSGAYTVLTDPSGSSRTINLHLADGTTDWGLWKATAALPSSARPGTWKIATQYVNGGTWNAGNSTTITVHQHTTLTLKAAKTTIKKGSQVKLTGRLGAWRPSGTWSGLPGRAITLYFRVHAAGASWTKFTTIKTGSTGTYSVSPGILRSGTFKIVYTGGGLYTGTTSPSIYITAK